MKLLQLIEKSRLGNDENEVASTTATNFREQLSPLPHKDTGNVPRGRDQLTTALHCPLG